MPTFIGNPETGENRFKPNTPFSGITGWTDTLTPEQVARLPWNAGVLPAGAAYDLPGGDPRAAVDFQESTGVDINKFREEANLAVAGVSGVPGEVPPQAVAAVRSGYANAIPRFSQIVLAGGDPVEAERLLFDPVRNLAKSLVLENRYREPSVKRAIVPPEYREIEGAGGKKMGIVWNPQTGSFQKFSAPTSVPPDVQRQLNRLTDELDMAAKGFLSTQGPIPPDPIKAAQIADEIVRTRKMYGIETPIPPEPAGSAFSVRTNSLPKIISIRRK